jgi:hypothetical protein
MNVTDNYIFAIISVITEYIITPLIMMVVWNNILIYIFGLSAITLAQAIGLKIFFNCIIGGPIRFSLEPTNNES